MELLNMDMKLLNMGAEALIRLFNNPPDCPFCGSRAASASAWIGDNIPAISCTNTKCAASNSWFSFSLWCTRPLEDALQKKLDKAILALEDIIRARGGVEIRDDLGHVIPLPSYESNIAIRVLKEIK
jgi:hypothetical protein